MKITIEARSITEAIELLRQSDCEVDDLIEDAIQESKRTGVVEVIEMTWGTIEI